MKKINNTLTLTMNKIFNNKIFSNKIFTHKITLFVVAAIAFISLYRHIIMYEFSAVLLFFIIAALAYNFTKNMTIVLGTAFLATFVVSMFKGLFGFKEGNENMDTSGNNTTATTQTTATTATTATTPTTAPTTTVPAATTTPTATTTTTQSATTAPAQTTGRASTNQNEISSLAALSTLTGPTLNGLTTPTTPTTQTTQNYQNQIPLTPGLYNMPNKEQMMKQLGKASETEQAYDNLEKIMGTKNIQSMSNDTKDLIKQQNDLIKQLKSMTPALNEAMNALGGLDLSKLTNIFNKPQETAE